MATPKDPYSILYKKPSDVKQQVPANVLRPGKRPIYANEDDDDDDDIFITNKTNSKESKTKAEPIQEYKTEITSITNESQTLGDHNQKETISNRNIKRNIEQKVEENNNKPPTRQNRRIVEVCDFDENSNLEDNKRKDENLKDLNNLNIPENFKEKDNNDDIDIIVISHEHNKNHDNKSKKQLTKQDNEKEKIQPQMELDDDELRELGIGGNDDQQVEEQEDDLKIPKNEKIEEVDHDEEAEDDDEEVLLRPVFVPKEKRLTLLEQEQKELDEKAFFEQKLKQKEQKKKETKQLVIKSIQKDLINEQNNTDDDEQSTNLPDDSDNINNLEEYEKWKLRELKRIKRQALEDELKEKERAEIERRRQMTDEERRNENLRLGSDDTIRPHRSKMLYLQKYYKVGTFFQDEKQGNLDHLFNRDYNLPTWEDKVNREALPSFLQVRRGLAGKKGRSKYTHLVAEDTTNFDKDYKVNEGIDQRLRNNLGGLKSANLFTTNPKK